MFTFLMIIHVIVSIILIAVILFQAGRGDMASAFGGGGAATNLFGTGAATFLSRATTVCATIFILTSLGLAVVANHNRSSLVEQASAKIKQLPAQTKDMAPASTGEKQKDETPKQQ